MKAFSELKQGLESAWESLAEGWQHLSERTSNALTRFKPTERSAPQAVSAEADLFPLRAPIWALMAGEVFEDERHVVVSLEAPGLESGDFNVEVTGDELVVRGEKRFSREAGEGRYRVLECAYGSFHRAFRLPSPVVADKAKASYRNGVLRIELPKSESARPRVVSVKVR